MRVSMSFGVVLFAAALCAAGPARGAIDVTVGSASVTAGNGVAVPVTVSGMGTGTSRSFQVNLAFSGTALTSPTAAIGAAVPGWSFAHNSPSAGTQIILCFEMGSGPATLDGVIFTSTFTVPAGTAAGAYPISISSAAFTDQASAPMTVGNLTSGFVTVSAGGGGGGPTSSSSGGCGASARAGWWMASLPVALLFLFAVFRRRVCARA